MNDDISFSSPQSKHDWWKPIMLLLVVLCIFIGSYILGLDRHIQELQPWIQSWGLIAPLVFLMLYIGAVILAIPATPLGILAGIMFGSTIGIVLITIGANIGGAITFLVARYFARESVARWVTRHSSLQRLDQLILIHGTIIVIITRLVPVFPFNLLNYSFGLTKVPFRTYLIWSFFGMLPGTIVFVGGADLLYQIFVSGQVSIEAVLFILSALVLLIGISWYAGKMIRTTSTNLNKKS